MITGKILATLLMYLPDIEVGYFDGEGHWIKATGVKLTQVDEANWRPILHEKQTGQMRDVIEVEGV